MIWMYFSNLMNKIKYTIKSDRSINSVLRRIEDLFNYESLKFLSDSNSIRSVKIPMPIVSFDRRFYSKKNYIGINPFIFISSIEINFKKPSTEKVIVDINIDQSRAFIIYLIVLLLTGMVAINLPNYWSGISLFSLVAIFTFIFIFKVCVKKLIKYEIFHTLEGKN